MHAIAYVFRKKLELTQDQFIEKYLAHGHLIARVAQGLVRYEQFPKRHAGQGDIYDSEESSQYDALSVYIFESARAAETTALMPEVVADSESFIDFATMITLPVSPRRIV